jgi:thiosulfate dehydrogenase [quinone] large subunit
MNSCWSPVAQDTPGKTGADMQPTSPIGAILRLAEHQPVLIGTIIAFAELAAGLGTLLGLYARAAALGGAILSFVFLMATNWHTSPIYQSEDLYSSSRGRLSS